jgi:rubrerythrin
MKEITETELTTRAKNGTVYVCRMCYDNRRKIVLVDYVVGGKHEVIMTMCKSCTEIMEHCPSCKKPKY